MGNIKAVIDRIIRGLSDKHAFENTVYRDEPILRPASSLDNYLPPALGELKTFGRTLYYDHRLDETAIFFRQAQKAIHLTDDAPLPPPFFAYSPTYRVLTDKQLRGYFSWRTAVRRREFSDIPAFVLIHAYELIHCLGADTVNEAFDQLQWLSDKTDDAYVKHKLDDILTDFYVYYLPDRREAVWQRLSENDTMLTTLYHVDDADDDALFTALGALSSYRLSQSRFVNQHPDVSRRAMCRAYRLLNEHCATHNNRSLFHRLFGKATTAHYRPFAGAVFLDNVPHDDVDVALSPLTHYHCENGVWHRRTAFTSRTPAPLLGELMKGTDAALRKAHHDPHPLKPPTLTKTVERLIEQAVAYAMTPPPKTITFDLSLLEDIRRKADITRDKLIVEEPEAPPPPVPPIRATVTPLDAAGTDVMRALLRGDDPHIAAASHRQMLSVICDSINETLFDIFADSVIDFDEDNPRVIEDYIDQLKGMF